MKKKLLVIQKITLSDIESIRLVEKKKEAIAIVGDAVGTLGGLASGATLFLGIAISAARPDLMVKEAIPLSILGLGLSYLATRIGVITPRSKDLFFTIYKAAISCIRGKRTISI